MKDHIYIYIYTHTQNEKAKTEQAGQKLSCLTFKTGKRLTGIPHLLSPSPRRDLDPWAEVTEACMNV